MAKDLESLFEKLADRIGEQVKAKRRSRRWAFLEARRTGEKLDPTPHELAGTGRPLTMREIVQQYVRTELSRHAEASGAGSFEEEDDFEEEDPEADLLSRYEVRNLVPEVAESLDGGAPEAPPSQAEPAKA